MHMKTLLKLFSHVWIFLLLRMLVSLSVILSHVFSKRTGWGQIGHRLNEESLKVIESPNASYFV